MMKMFSFAITKGIRKCSLGWLVGWLVVNHNARCFDGINECKLVVIDAVMLTSGIR